MDYFSDCGNSGKTTHQIIEDLLDDAFLDGDSQPIRHLLCEISEDQYLENVAEKIAESLNSCLDFLNENEAIVKNILKILTDLMPILRNNEEHCYDIADCMLKIAAEERVPVSILRCAIFNLNLLLIENGLVLNRLKTHEPLEGFLLIIGRKMQTVGDFECQSNMFETLCYIIYGSENKQKWIQSWFPDDEKTRSMFLNWNMEQFTVESRKILNQINRREENPRTYAFAATAVYFGDVQLSKLAGLEFWIDFNYDSKSISFFCKDFDEPEDEETSMSWETVVISSDHVKSYSVKKREDIKCIELCITLNCSCKDLLVSSTPLFETTNIVCINFWIYVDISSHLRMIFGKGIESEGSRGTRKVSSSVDALGVGDQDGSQKTRKVSLSVDALGVGDQDGAAARDIRKISDSEVVKIEAEDYYEKKRGKFSDSAELVCPSDDASNFHIANNVRKSLDSSQKRKVSSCSLFLKESDSERSYEMKGKNEQARFKFERTVSTEKHSINNKKLTNEEYENVTNRHYSKKSSLQDLKSERKSSDATCAFDYRSDNSSVQIIDTVSEKIISKEIPANLLREIHEIPYEKQLVGLQTTSEGFLENENLTDKVSSFKFQKFVQDVGVDESVSNSLSKKSPQSIKTDTGLSLKNSKLINSNDSVKSSRKKKRSICSEGSQTSQKDKKVDGSTEISQSLLDEVFMISPTPANRKKIRKTAVLTPNNLEDHNSLEALNYFANNVDATEYDKSISHKTIVDQDTEDFKNLNSSQTQNSKDGTPNNRQKKIRLFNINRDPIFDVPPSQQKKVIATPVLKNSPFVDLSPKHQNKNVLLSSLPLSDEDFCETKIFRKKSTDSIETKKKHIFKHEASDKDDNNELSESNILDMGQIKDQESKSSKQDTSEIDLHLSDKDATSIQPRKKRLKKNSDEVCQEKPMTSRLSKRKSDNVEKEVTSDETPPKKQRKAAIKAMKRNKILLKKRESEHTSEVFSEKSANINHSNDEIEEVFCTPPTKPVKKRKLKSVFCTDTETGSSNASWLGGPHTCLFETPQKRYSKRMKSKHSFENITPKKKTYKSRAKNSEGKRKSKNSMNGSEIKSKSGLSDLENYELIVERKTDRKKSSSSHHKHFTLEDVSKALNDVLEKLSDKQYSDDELDKEQNIFNMESGMYDNSDGFNYDGDLHPNEYQDKEDLISSEGDPANINKMDFKSIFVEEQNIVKMKPRFSFSKERYSRTSLSSYHEKGSSTNPELHSKSLSNDLTLSKSAKERKSISSVEKRKTDDLSTLKGKAERNKRDSNKMQGIASKIGSHINDDFNIQDSIPESPNIPENDKNSISSTNGKETDTYFHPTCPSPRVGILTEQSLSSLEGENDEVEGKKLHIQKFLEDLPDEFNSSKNIEYPATQAVSSQKNEMSKSKSGNLSEYSKTKKHLFEEIKNSDLSSARKCSNFKNKKQFTCFEESDDKSKASSKKDLQKFSLLDHHSVLGMHGECSERLSMENYHHKIIEGDERKPSKQLSVLHILGVETDNMTHKLLKTLQKHFYNFNLKLAASREKMLATASALNSKENDWNPKDLRNIAKAYKMNRIQAEKSLKEILLVGEEYFEAEKKLDYKMKRLHKKALKKYAARTRIAGRYAVEALENRAAAKTEVLLRSILKKIDHL